MVNVYDLFEIAINQGTIKNESHEYKMFKKNKINIPVYTKVNIIMNQSGRHDS